MEMVRFHDSYLKEAKCSNRQIIKNYIISTTSTTTKTTKLQKRPRAMTMTTTTSKSNSKPSKAILTSESGSSPFAEPVVHVPTVTAPGFDLLANRILENDDSILSAEDLSHSESDRPEEDYEDWPEEDYEYDSWPDQHMEHTEL